MTNLFKLRVNIGLDVKENISFIIGVILIGPCTNKLDVATIKSVADADGHIRTC